MSAKNLPQARLRLILAQLESMKDSVPDVASQTDANRYNSLIDELLAHGYEVQDLRVGQDDMFLSVFQQMEVHYRVLNQKIHAALRFFQLSRDAEIVELNAPRRE